MFRIGTHPCNGGRVYQCSRIEGRPHTVERGAFNQLSNDPRLVSVLSLDLRTIPTFGSGSTA
jgi:hypothetical protein